jgi:hypothetical protein
MVQVKKYVWLVAILAAVVVLSLATACGGGGEKGAATPPATVAGKQAAPTSTPKEATAKPAEGWADIPIYSGAKSVQEWKMSLPGMAPGQEYEKVEWRYYTTQDAVTKVADFYRSEMPKKGWKETLWMAAQDTAWGMYTSKDDNVGAGIYVMKDESENVTGIMIWRGEKGK